MSTTTIDELTRQARNLSKIDRARLAESLLESLQAPDAATQADWDQEIEARVAAFDRGEMGTYPAEDVFAEARRLAR